MEVRFRSLSGGSRRGGERLCVRAQRLVVEIDGYAFHSSRRSFERDRERDARLVGAGWRVIRITWRQIEQEPVAVAATLAAALAA